MSNRQNLLQLSITLVAIAGLFLGAGGLVLQVRLDQISGQPAFLSPFFSIILMLCGLSLFAARSYPRYSRLWAIITLVLIALAQIPQLLSETGVHGRPISAYFATALIVVGSMASLVYHAIFQPPRYRAARKDFVVAFVGVGVSTLISLALIAENIESRQHVAAASARAVTNDLRRHIQKGPALIDRMSERFGALDPVPSERFFLAEFRRYLRDFPFFAGLMLLDQDAQPIHQVSKNSGIAAAIKNISQYPELESHLHQAMAVGQMRVAVIDMACCEPDTAVAMAPIFGLGLNNWSVAAFINLGDLVTWAMDQAGHDGYHKVNYQGSVLYQSPGARPSNIAASGYLDVLGGDHNAIQLSYMYTSADLSQTTDVLADFVWLAGILFTLLLISSQRMTKLASQHAEQLSHNALHDPLTGLPNRRSLEEVLSRSCARAKRDKQPLAVVFFDVEGVKLVNDTIGHDMGDQIIIEIANRLKRHSLEGSAVTQLSGIEFVQVIVGISLRQVQEHTQDLINELCCPYTIDGRSFTMIASAGIVSSDGRVDDPMKLVRRADLAMLEAKKEGPNAWHTYTDNLSISITERVELRNDLQSALDTGTLELYYQPIVEGQSGRVIGVEALARWFHETRGYISPARFIPLAEETGQIATLTQWALRTACQDSMRLQEQGLYIPVVVNISPLYFQHADFLQSIQQSLKHTGLPPRFLQLEITETVLVDNEKPSIIKLNQLKDMGIKMSIDDFGTGYSSLSYLKRLPIDKVKIDRSFIDNVVDDPTDAAITQAIISMAHHLNLRVVAEGVETVAQLAFLRRRHCDTFQGYLFARPMPMEQLLEVLTKSRGYLFPYKKRPAQTRI